MRLIDADSLLERLETVDFCKCVTFGETALFEKSVMEAINNAPTITPDMAQVLAYECGKTERKHGEWIKNEGRFGWHCSECKVDNFYAYVRNSETGKNDLQDRYCPNCGAEIGKGEEE